ncbi:FAD-dependent 5-carboxymethylaminomethyl-2-thiouridine(34) oxidoreductase MnmC [Roseateles sp.]|uniref:FAD-dependent 5-carboxymethylaminomethyl-2-thiouridine(34) oxidoreductase MnmC n=1 Tax=Roseateles sp. TaxID=1971397 RepID=UPI0032674189
MTARISLAPVEVGCFDPAASARAQHVFVAGNGLPGRWQGRDGFVVLETRFGLGHNFLATWQAWRQDPARCERLMFVSLEAQPPHRDDLAATHAGSEVADLAAQLAERWPPLTTGLHTLSFEGGRVELLLGLGDTRALLRELVLAADAICLDGRQRWDRYLSKSLARLAAPGATVASESVDPELGDGLRAAGFEVERRADMSMARFLPRHTLQRPAGREPVAPGAKRAVILGAGLAGAACALALSRAGVACTVVDRLPGPAQASSGNPAGLFHGTVNPDDGPHARFNRAAALATQSLLAELGLPHQRGLLRLETRLALAQMQGAPGYVQALSADEASALAGTALGYPAWFYPGGGALDPAAYTRAMLAASGADLWLHTPVAALREAAGGWQLLDAGGQVIAEAPLVVLADGHAQLPLLGDLADDLTVQRGQLSHLADAPWQPALPVAGDGYAIADGHGGAWCGATAQDGDTDAALREADQADNLARYARLAGVSPPPPSPLAGRVAWRLVAADRLPLIGALAAAGPLAAQLRLQPRRAGLIVSTAFGSRGIGWAALGGRLVAALALGSPRPLEAELLDAVDPLRFALRRQRKPGR